MERYEAGGPGGTGVGPDGVAQPWQAVPPGYQPAMPPCSRCGAAFAAHLDGRCPPAQAATDRITVPPWAAGQPGPGQPYPSWVPPPGGPPPMVGPNPPRHNWVRRHPLLTGVIVLIALSTGIGVGILSASGQTTSSASASASASSNGNATACRDYWNIENAAAAYDIATELADWQKLRAAAPGITNPALSAAVTALDQDLSAGDTVDAGTAGMRIGTACQALGYADPQPAPSPFFIPAASGQ